jgi:hypothetical protein
MEPTYSDFKEAVVVLNFKTSINLDELTNIQRILYNKGHNCTVSE